MKRNLLLLALLILPAAARAVSPYSGPPNTFIGLDLSNFKAYIKVDLAANGKFTGILDFAGGSRNTIKGTLDTTGSFSGTASKTNIPYVILVTGSTPSTYSLTGSAGGELLMAFPLAYSKGQTVSEKGTYTSFLATNGTSNAPQGYGYAKITVSKSAEGSIRGKLPDGTTFTASSKIVAAGTTTHVMFLDDSSLYNKKGYLFGYYIINGTPNLAELLWDKPAGKGAYYPAGFSTPLTGELFTYSKTGPMFTTGTLTFGDGGLATTGTQAFTVSKGVVTVTPPNPFNVKLSINGATGAVKGSFDYPHMVSGKTVNSMVKYSGVLLQDGTEPIAVGYFLSPVVSGSGLSGAVEAIP